MPSKYFPTVRLKSKDWEGAFVLEHTVHSVLEPSVFQETSIVAALSGSHTSSVASRLWVPSVGVSQVIFFPLMSSKQSCFSGSALNDSISSLSPPLACFQMVPFAFLTYLSHFLHALPELPRVGFLIDCFAQHMWQDLDSREVSIQWHAHVAFYLVPLTKYIPEGKQRFPSPSVCDSLSRRLSGQRESGLSESFLIKDYIDSELQTMWFLCFLSKYFFP